MSTNPYTEKLINENVTVREFSVNVSQDELEWHRDHENRTVTIVEGTGWFFQEDNNIPKKLSEGDEINIQAGVFHRLIKGDTNLIVSIIKESKKKKDQNKDGENTFADVQIARYLASGMSKEEIKEKHPELFSKDMDEGKKKRKKRKSSNLSKMKKRKLPSQYGAKKGSKRRKALDRAAAAYASGDVKKAARIADAENAKQRKKGIPQTKRRDTGMYTESKQINELNELINDMVEEQLLDAMLNELENIIDEKKKRKKRKKKKSKKRKSGGGLSAAVKKSLNKKADKRCLTRGSVYSEFRKGLAAYLSSGSRKGMSAHQWAHARVNSANPSKSWATVKKRKTCPKKKGKKK